MARSKGNEGDTTVLPGIGDYRHEDATRKNIPPAKIAAEGRVPVVPPTVYSYSPRLDPVLRFDQTGAADRLPSLLDEARRRPLTDAEAKMLAEALRVQEPWVEWAGKREAKALKVDPVALHIHERVSAQAILRVATRQDVTRDLFADPKQDYRRAVQFYQHDVDWANRLILGDSLQVMASLAKRENLAGKVQMIYIDPPYGIKFGSNFQNQVNNRDILDREADLTREPEMVRAYRDTWHLGRHSYLSYLRGRIVAARELLTDTGSIFVQIGPDNVHVVRNVLDECFGTDNFVAQIVLSKTSGQTEKGLPTVCDFILWYAKDQEQMKYQPLYGTKQGSSSVATEYTRAAMPNGARVRLDDVPVELVERGDAKIYRQDNITSQSVGRAKGEGAASWFPVDLNGEVFRPSMSNRWKTNEAGMKRLLQADRLEKRGTSLSYVRFLEDFPVVPISNVWFDAKFSSRSEDKLYVVQTAARAIERCMLMTTDPGDLVLDPTCGSGTTAAVAEQWGRRWITIDTSRVAVSIARQRLTTARFDYYELKDKQRGVAGGFKCKTVPHIMLKNIAQNPYLDPVFARHEPVLDQRLADLNAALAGVTEQHRQALAAKLVAKQREFGRRAATDADVRRWQLPRAGERFEHWTVPFDTDPDHPQPLADAIVAYRAAWRAKMDDVNDCISRNAEQEELIDQPVLNDRITRVSGPFTVEAVQPPEISLDDGPEPSPIGGEPEELEDVFEAGATPTEGQDQARNAEAYLDQMMRLLRVDGVRFPNNKVQKFSRLDPLSGSTALHAEGRWHADGEADPDPEGQADVCVAIGPQYGPVTAPLVEQLIRASSRRGYDHLVVAGFSFDGAAQAVIEEATNPNVSIHMAHIRPDVNPGMQGLLKEQPGSQLFTVFGRPRTVLEGPSRDGEYTIAMEGVDIYDPVSNAVLPTGADKVAAWFLDTDYDGRAFCVTQAFFPDKTAWSKLSKALDRVVDPSRFEALSGTKSLPFPPGEHRTVAVKVIDPRGNEVMRIHRLEDRA